MSERLDKVLDAIDQGLQHSREAMGATELPPDGVCISCMMRPTRANSSWCGRCHPCEPDPGDICATFAEEANRLRAQLMEIICSEWPAVYTHTWVPGPTFYDDEEQFP